MLYNFHNSLRPPGYILGCLQPCTFYCSLLEQCYWTETLLKIMEAMIKMFPSSAVYLAASPANPVAWIIYYLQSHMGHWFTVQWRNTGGKDWELWLQKTFVKSYCVKRHVKGYKPILNLHTYHHYCCASLSQRPNNINNYFYVIAYI